MKKFVFLLIICSLLIMPSCAEEKPHNRQIYAMDTVCSISVYGKEEVADKISELLFELSGELSAYDGKVGELNSAGGGKMSENIRELFYKSYELKKETDGAFSPYLGSVIELWGIGEKNYVPDEKELSFALSSAEEENAEATGDLLTLRNGARLNFGAVAKGYASDKIREILIENKVKGAVVSLGGNVYVHGKSPSESPWRVGLRDPKGNENEYIGTVSVSDRFIISSGDYERYFKRDGKRYHHIIDPQTGAPCESDLLSVAVISEEGTPGDAYSTALYVMGKEEALSFWRENRGFELVLICRDGKVIVTEGISGVFAPNEERGYTYETAYR